MVRFVCATPLPWAALHALSSRHYAAALPIARRLVDHIYYHFNFNFGSPNSGPSTKMLIIVTAKRWKKGELSLRDARHRVPPDTFTLAKTIRKLSLNFKNFPRARISITNRIEENIALNLVKPQLKLKFKSYSISLNFSVNIMQS